MKRAIDADFVPMRAWLLQRDGWAFRVYLTKKKAARAKKIRKSGNGKRKWTIIKVWIAGGAENVRAESRVGPPDVARASELE